MPDTTLTSAELDELERLAKAATGGTWRAVAHGGMSTVVTTKAPPRNDHRTNNTYGYRGEEFCIGAPFLDDDGRPRLDYVEFGHDDAHYIVAARNNFARLLSLARAGLEAGKAEESMRESAAVYVENLPEWNGSDHYCDSCHNTLGWPDGEDVAKEGK